MKSRDILARFLRDPESVLKDMILEAIPTYKSLRSMAQEIAEEFATHYDMRIAEVTVLFWLNWARMRPVGRTPSLHNGVILFRVLWDRLEGKEENEEKEGKK